MLKLALNKLGLKRLEPYDGKPSRTVLRGWKSWKLLFYYPTLKHSLLLPLVCYALSSYALENEEEKEIMHAVDQAKEYVLKEMLEKYSELKQLEGKAHETIKESNILLRVFVSSSMPKALLKSYAKDAEKFKAVLVFKGLPNGSFKELIKLVTEIEQDGVKAPMLIDDQAFDDFNVKSVPAFVLSKEPGVLKLEKGKVTYDKITGNIGIKAALEKFKDSGELKEEASQWLSNSY